MICKKGGRKLKMRMLRSLKNVLLIIYVISSVLCLVSTVVLLINTNENKGILPVILFLCLIFFITYFMGNILYNSINRINQNDNESKPIIAFEIIKIIIAVFMFIVSLFVLWI